MSIRTSDVGRISLADSYKRECPPDATPEALAAQTAAFLSGGGKVQEIPAGVSVYVHTMRSDKPKAAKRKIRTEDYA